MLDSWRGQTKWSLLEGSWVPWRGLLQWRWRRPMPKLGGIAPLSIHLTFSNLFFKVQTLFGVSYMIQTKNFELLLLKEKGGRREGRRGGEAEREFCLLS